MRRYAFILMAALVLAGGPSGIARADDPPPPPGPSGPPVLKSDVDAGCVYGTESATTFTPKSYSQGYTTSLAWNSANAPSSDCNIVLAWVPFSRHSITLNYSIVMASENNDAATNNGPCPAGAADPNCRPGDWQQFLSSSATYRCTSDIELNCISSISAIDEAGKEYKGDFVRGFPAKPAVPASSGNGAWVPAGGATPLWSFSLPTGTVNVLTNGVMETNWRNENGRWAAREGIGYRLTLFGVDIVPDDSVPKPDAEWQEMTYEGKSVKKFTSGPMTSAKCISFDVGECAREVPLPEGYRFRVAVQMPEGAVLFMNGRLTEPFAYTEPMPGGFRFVIEAAPTDVLAVAQAIPKRVISKSTVDKVLSDSRRGDNWVFQRSNADNFMEGAGSESLLWLNAVMPLIGDRSSWVSRIWSVSTAKRGFGFSPQCEAKAKSSFLGIVSSNATAYTGEPPVYNSKTATLEYEISAPHYLPDGKSAASGRYALNLNTEFMLCLLGVSKVPDQASIQLTYGDGEVNAGTINVKQTKNWLNLIAANFHFSSPKIQVSFATAKPAATSTTVAKPSGQTITCTKGKLVKKVRASKCPAGYRKR